MREDAFGNGGLARRCFDLDSRFRGKGFGAGNSSGARRESVQSKAHNAKAHGEKALNAKTTQPTILWNSPYLGCLLSESIAKMSATSTARPVFA